MLHDLGNHSPLLSRLDDVQPFVDLDARSANPHLLLAVALSHLDVGLGVEVAVDVGKIVGLLLVAFLAREDAKG